MRHVISVEVHRIPEGDVPVMFRRKPRFPETKLEGGYHVSESDEASDT